MSINRDHLKQGFTLVELLVVIAIMSMLLGIATVGTNRMLSLSKETRETAAMREVLHAYTSAALDRNGKLLEGYPTDELVGVVYGPDGEIIPANMPHSKRYVWRLLPYLDDAIGALYVNKQMPILSGLAGTDCYTYMASIYPSFGLNEVWMGGHKDTTLHPNSAMQAIFRGTYARSLSDVRNPSRQLVFATAQAPLNLSYGQNCLSGDGDIDGFWKIQAPRGPSGWQWSTEGTQDAPLPSLDSADQGWIATRHSNKAITGQLDGSVEKLTLGELTDMRRWSIGASTHQWEPTP